MFGIACTKKVVIVTVAAVVVVIAVVAITLGVVLTRTKTTVLKFPDNFKFGAASAAYQVEGAWDIDGKGPSIWDTFTHNFPERIADRSNGDVATNSYYLYKEDVKALKEMNSQFYRFSVSWPRVMANGDISSRNQKGIDYYNNLIDELIANGIEPVVTMFHWDMPQYIQDLGGLTNPNFVNYFEQYANLLFAEYGDRVTSWITFNEPALFCQNGYGTATWPPAISQMGVGDYLCSHFVVLSHARVYHLYRDKYFATQQGKIGISLNVAYNFPEDPSDPTHIEARDRGLEFFFGIFAHPLIHGDYPAVVRANVDRNSAEEGRERSRLPNIDDVAYVKGTTDFIGLNYYTSTYVKPAAVGTDFPTPSIRRDTFVTTWIDESWPLAKSPWLRSIPSGLHQLLIWIKDHYNNVEVVITENGWSDDGELNDVGRETYLREHFHAVYDAIQDGCNVTAHATWSIVDNFEWLLGYTEKFGVYRVDVEDPNLLRVAKDSVLFLADLFAAREFSVENKTAISGSVFL